VRPVVFPYSLHRGIPHPIIPLEIRGARGEWKTIWMYVDSGAFVSILAEGEARVLGLEIERGQLTYSIVGDGSMIPVYVHQVPIRVGSIELTARLGFSPRLGVGFNLLGRQDLFTHFDVTFSDATRTVTFRPRA